jgi:hypothetical protein
LEIGLSQINVRRLIGETNACIRCECGVEIALTPDEGQLGREIEEHALQHKRKETDPRKSEAVFNKVHDQLIAQVFAKVP